jgi:hypothetical protein
VQDPQFNLQYHRKEGMREREGGERERGEREEGKREGGKEEGRTGTIMVGRALVREEWKCLLVSVGFLPWGILKLNNGIITQLCIYTENHSIGPFKKVNFMRIISQ